MFNIDTDRLRLRKLDAGDTHTLHEILGDAETMQYYPAPYDMKGTARWIEKSRLSYQENGFGLWAVVLKSSGRFIGQCGISRVAIDGEIVPEIGYHIHRSFWNQGYATEAAQACLRYGFDDLGLERLYVHTWEKNIPSQRVAEKIGMRRLKEYDKYLPAHDITWRHVVFALGRDEFRAGTR